MPEVYKHLITLGITSLLWFGFLLGGLPTNYYRKVPFKPMLLFCLFSFLGMGVFIYYGLLLIWQGNYFVSSAWCAFYATVPLFIYDLAYLGIYRRLGLSFLKSHWYLTFFYIILWPEFLLIGWLLNGIASYP